MLTRLGVEIGGGGMTCSGRFVHADVLVGPRRQRRLLAACVAVVISALFVPGVVAAASAADFNPAPGTYTVDTSALTLTGPGTSVTGTNVGGVAVFSFGNVNIQSGVTINASGSRPLKIAASGTFTLAGVINGSGMDDTRFLSGPILGGPGGGAGGQQTAGGGPGGGGAPSDSNNGGGGGGFGGMGAPGGVCSQTSCPGESGTAGAGGASYGNLNTSLQGGSGGGGATNDNIGGGGGGAIALFGSSVTVAPTGEVLANGGGGDTGNGGASGGGSGGAILIHGDTVEVDGFLDAGGGPGGAGGCCGDGGGGGGGRIAYQYRTLVAVGTAFVFGGASGARSTDGFSSGGPSPDPTGADGVVTKTQAATATTTPATAVTQTGATLNGDVNPNSNRTTYHFEYGTTTAYGSTVPVPDALVGSDSSDHALSASIAGLAPNTTYHYRIVATDGIGFTTIGPDVGFTTPPAPPPPTPPTPPPPPPPPSPSMIASGIGPTDLLTFTCQGAGGQTCAGGFTVTAHVRELGTTPVAVTARKHKKKPKPRIVQVNLGSGSYRVAGGSSRTITFTLNSTGRKLLSKFWTVPTTFTFSVTSGNPLSPQRVIFLYPRITSPIAFDWIFHPSFTTVAQLVVSGVPAGGTVKVGCSGPGCPFANRSFNHKRRVGLTGPFAGAHLAPGTKLEILITAANRVGKVAIFTIQSGAAPTEVTLCLPPGSRRPRKC
jgi:hypothetical protein